jgi:hypothetical protein
MRFQFYLIFVLCVFTIAATCTIDTFAQQIPPAETRHTPIEIGTSFTFPEGADLYGLGVGAALTPRFGFGIYYSLTQPEEADYVLHGFGGGVRFDVLKENKNIPLDLSFLCSASFTEPADLPKEIRMDGQAYTIGVSFGRFVLLTDRVGIAFSVMPSWTKSYSKLDVSGRGENKDEDELLYWSGSFSLIIRELISIAPYGTFGEGLTAPGVSITIRNTFFVRGGIIKYDSETVPSFSFGLIL